MSVAPNRFTCKRRGVLEAGLHYYRSHCFVETSTFPSRTHFSAARQLTTDILHYKCPLTKYLFNIKIQKQTIDKSFMKMHRLLWPLSATAFDLALEILCRAQLSLSPAAGPVQLRQRHQGVCEASTLSPLTTSKAFTPLAKERPHTLCPWSFQFKVSNIHVHLQVW